MMIRQSASIRAFIDDMRGATAIEYGVMAAAAAGIVFIAGNQLSDRLEAGLAKTDAIIAATTLNSADPKATSGKEETKNVFPEFWELRD